VPTGMGGKIDIKVNVPDRLIAPLLAGQVVGDVTVALPDGTILTKQPLVVAQPVEADGFLGRMWDTLLLLTE
jgi:D-alanyl-D-alanine carboxypeptidase